MPINLLSLQSAREREREREDDESGGGRKVFSAATFSLLEEAPEMEIACKAPREGIAKFSVCSVPNIQCTSFLQPSKFIEMRFSAEKQGTYTVSVLE